MIRLVTKFLHYSAEQMFPTGLLHAVPNDETLSVKEAMKLREKPVKKNGTLVTSTNALRRKEPESLCFCPQSA